MEKVLNYIEKLDTDIYSDDEKAHMRNYIHTLTELELDACNIAIDFLKTSFNLYKS